MISTSISFITRINFVISRRGSPLCLVARRIRGIFRVECIYPRSCLFFLFFSFLSKQREIKLADRFSLRFESCRINIFQPTFFTRNLTRTFFHLLLFFFYFFHSRSQSMRGVSSACPSIEYANIPVYRGTPRRSFDCFSLEIRAAFIGKW